MRQPSRPENDISRFAGDLRFRPRRREQPVGRIAYTYSIDARSMVIAVEAATPVSVDIAAGALATLG